MKHYLSGIIALLFLCSALPSLAADPPKKLKLRQEAPAASGDSRDDESSSQASGTWKDPYTGMEFIFVKGGCYRMGDTSGDHDKTEPLHRVCVDDFWLGKYEVTQGEWVKVMGNNPSKFLECGQDCPVEQISYGDAQTFIGRLKKNTGKKFRLPTEAEWEFACRSGGKDQKYCGGSNLDELGWYNGNSGDHTQPAGIKEPNGLGIYDMTGNVWEWCSDWYDKGYYGYSPANNPRGPENGEYRVLRGGSWGYIPRDARVALRSFNVPSERSGSSGFRLVVVSPK